MAPPTLRAERLGVGTSSPSSLLHLASNAPYITFEDIDNNQDWQIQATAWFAIRNQTTSTEAMRIDSSGNLFVGKTASTLSIAGHAFGAAGWQQSTADSRDALRLNRTTNDGDIAKFFKDSTEVGSIGAVSGDLFVGTGDTGVRFLDGSNAYIPYNPSTAVQVVRINLRTMRKGRSRLLYNLLAEHRILCKRHTIQKLGALCLYIAKSHIAV